MPALQDQPPIFIGGAGRSGTTLLRVMLDSHPNIVCGPELKFIPDWLREWQRERRLFEQHLASLLGIRASLIDDAYRAKISELLDGARRKYHKPRIAEKSPNNVLVFGHLGHLFPDSPMIHVIRDGRDVVASLLGVEWYRPDGKRIPYTEDAETAARYWADTVSTGMRARKHLGERVLEVRYEALVTEPESMMRRILVHVGEPWDDAVLHHVEHDHNLATETSADQVRQPVHSKSIGRWRAALDESDRRVVERVAGPLLERLGYS